MNQSEDIKELIIALSKAQSGMGAAKFNKVNPHFKNRYADFTSIMEACRRPLAENGLAIMQYCETINEKLMLVTMLAHVTGQWIKSYFPLNPANMTSQAIGSAMTYAKRYSLSAMLGIVSDEEDDDGEASHGRNQPKVACVSKISQSQINVLKNLEDKLDDECLSKIHAWLRNTLKISEFADITTDNFGSILNAFQNAVKYMENREVVNA